MVVYHYEANCQAEKKWFTIVNVKVTVRAYIIKFDYFYYIFQTAGPFAIKLSLVVQHYKPEWAVVKLGYRVQGQGHSEGSYYQNITLTTISSELLILWQPNLVR